MTFSQLNLDQPINKALMACGYTTPTPIQAKSIPAILEGKDLVASAQTGSGKTAAFVLPALQHLSSKQSSKKTRILILTPTRELASQITKAASLYGKFLRFNIVNLVGGMPYHQQIRDLARGADIIVATPGRLLDHIESKRVDLSHVDMLVLDEADRMLDMGFIDDVEAIAKLTPADRQTLLFSATVDKQLGHIVRHLLKNPVRIDLSTEKLTVPQIKQELYKANNLQHKVRLLNHFLSQGNIYKAIIFTATKRQADHLADMLNAEGFAAAALHGDLKQNVRNRTIDKLRKSKIQFLVATDVAARGIDISDLTHVFNFDLPRFCEDYVHRIGRTGRAGKSGVAISFILPADMRNLQRIERYIGQRIKIMHQAELGPLQEPANKGSYSPISHAETHAEKKNNFENRKKFTGNKRNRSADSFHGEDEERAPNRYQKSDKKFYGDRKGDSFDREPKRKKRFSDGDERETRYQKSDKKFYGDRKSDSFDRESPRKKRYFDNEERDSNRSQKSDRKFYGDRKEGSFDREPQRKKRYFDNEERDSNRHQKSEKRHSFDHKQPRKKRFSDGEGRDANGYQKSDKKHYADRKREGTNNREHPIKKTVYRDNKDRTDKIKSK